VTRISSFLQQQALLSQLQKTNERAFSEQVKISTGKNAQQYKDMPDETGVLLAAKRVEAQTGAFQNTNAELVNTLNLQDTSLSQLASSSQDLREAVLNGTSLDSGQTLMQQVDGIFQQAVSVLNTQVNGVYIYGGTKTDQAPVTAKTLGDLTAAPAASNVFVNNQQRLGVEISAGQTLQYNFLADQVGGQLMASLKRIADFNAGPNGPFGAQLTDVQKQFLQGEVQNIATITEQLNQVVGQNGQLQQTVDDANTRLGQTDTNVKGFISDIEDADVAQAVANLNQSQVMLQASAKLIADLKDNSLLNYI
jgi:flagellar hook-associated protein 3 FlgL